MTDIESALELARAWAAKPSEDDDFATLRGDCRLFARALLALHEECERMQSLFEACPCGCRPLDAATKATP